MVTTLSDRQTAVVSLFLHLATYAPGMSAVVAPFGEPSIAPSTLEGFAGFGIFRSMRIRVSVADSRTESPDSSTRTLSVAYRLRSEASFPKVARTVDFTANMV